MVVDVSQGETFAGRRRELALLAADAEAVRAGRARVAAIEGPPGIGKTELLRRFIAFNPSPILLKASGDEAEVGLSWGILDQLLTPLDRLDDDRGGAEARQLRRLIATPGRAPDPLSVGAQLVALLGALQTAGPVLLVVDDLHLADPPSTQALLFACRRLAADRVLVLLAWRTEEAERLAPGWQRLLGDPERAGHIELPGLDAGELQELSRALGRGDLSTYVAARLRERTGGHPLYARAILDELTPAELAGAAGPLRAPRSLSQAVLATLANCSEPARDLVTAAAVLGLHCRFAEAARLAGIDEPPAVFAVFDEARVHRLLLEGESPGAIAFPHPLVRAAVYHDIPPARRTALHSAAARLLTGDAALAHRVAAGWDAGLAQDLELRAREEIARRDLRRGATFLLQASDLSPNAELRVGRLLEGAELMLACGEVGEALARERALLDLDATPRRDYLLGYLSLLTARASEAERYLQAAWRANPSGSSLAARIALQLSAQALMRCEPLLAADWARRSLAAVGSDPFASAYARVRVGVGLALAGRLAEARELWDGVSPAEFEASPDLFLGRGLVRLWSDELTKAREDLASTFQIARSGGPVGLIGQAIGYFAEAETRLGALAEAAMHAELGVSMALAAGRDYDLTFIQAITTRPYALLGEWEQAERHCRAAEAAARACEWEAAWDFAAVARATLATARGDADALLAAAHAIPAAARSFNPSALAGGPLEAEALVMLGRLDEAEASLAAYEAAVCGLSRRFGDVAIARVRGRLLSARGEHATACAELERRLALAEDLEMPIERARLLLAYGEALRRRGARSRAVQELQRARSLFAGAGARPFLEECERELAACGVRAERPGAGGPGQLTPQERVVAGLVAGGLSNAEVAGRLVITVNTVEYHLRNIYAKLGVASRVQLAAQFSSGAWLTPPGGETLPARAVHLPDGNHGDP